jgi:hypothetical protein
VDRLFDLPECRKPLKIRRSSDGRRVALVTDYKPGPHLFLWSADEPAEPIGVNVGSRADEIRLIGDAVLLTVEDDALVVVDAREGEVLQQVELNKLVTPPSNAPEDLVIDPTESYVVVSVQKDNASGKKKGSRLLVFDQPSIELVADLPLPRKHPELHIEGNLKEQGPGPEVLYIAPACDTLAVTLDLYGAIGLMSWSHAQQGRLDPQDWTLVGTSSSPELDGLSFPDRATGMNVDGREMFLVCNSGVAGGSVLVDLAQRKAIWRGATPPGLEPPLYVPALRRAFSVCSGKTKRREADDVIKEYHPQQSLISYQFPASLEPAECDTQVEVRRIPLGAYTWQIALASIEPAWLLVAVGDDPKRPDTLLTVNAVSGQIVDRQSAGGTVGRFE